MEGLFKEGTLTVSNNREGLPQEVLDKVNELRKQRNDFTNKATEIQNQIDKIFLDHANFNELVGKNIKIEEENITTYIYNIVEVKRLFYSAGHPKCRLDADYILRTHANGDFTLWHMYDDFDLTTTNYQIISTEDFIKAFTEASTHTLLTITSNDNN